MPTPTVAQTFETIRGLLPRESANYWSDDDLLDAYNDAVDEIADATEFYERHVVVKRRKWAVYTDLRQILPTDALRVTAVWNIATQKWLAPTTTRELDESVGRGWEKNSDINTRWWFMQGLWHLGAYPVAGDDTSPLKVYFAACPPHVMMTDSFNTGLQLTQPLPFDFNAAIENFMLSTLLADQRESTKAIERWNEFIQIISQLDDTSKQRMSRVRTPRMGARR